VELNDELGVPPLVGRHVHTALGPDVGRPAAQE